MSRRDLFDNGLADMGEPSGCPPYRAMQNHLETFLALCRDDWEDERVSPHAERELRAYLHVAFWLMASPGRVAVSAVTFLVAFSCKGRAVCTRSDTLPLLPGKAEFDVR